MEIVELTDDTWPSLETLFSANKTVGGCWCCWFMRPHADVDDGEPFGWVAVAPRMSYPRLETSKVSRSDAGPDTWSVTCFFVHRTARRRGLAASLLGSGDLYHGTLAMFEAAGFTLIDRRGTRRALVRREL